MSIFKLSLIFAGILLLIGVGAAVIYTVLDNSHKQEIISLKNEIAKRDVTIEVQKDVYTKLSMSNNDLKTALDQTDKENQALLNELHDRKAEILTAQTLIVKWKKAYEAEVAGHQTEVTTPEGIVRKQVDFKKDFGYLVVEGNTLTDPPEAHVKVTQGRPLKFSVVMTQDKDQSWRGYATSSDENMAVDLAVSAVNPYLLAPKWYEKVGVSADLAAGSGFLVGVGVSYKIGKITIGPHGWGVLNWNLQPAGYVGVSVGITPFERN